LADDALDPEGLLAISYADAQARARVWFDTVTKPAQPNTGPYTVRHAVADYLDWFRATGRKSIKETEASVKAFILPNLGDDKVPSLSAAQLRKWHSEIAAAAPRLRTKPGNQQKVRDTAGDPEARRRRRATANRILTVLKAALNHAWREGKVPSDASLMVMDGVPLMVVARNLGHAGTRMVEKHYGHLATSYVRESGR
jgi:hypothetical protein